jgi:hypothetical protein
LMMRYFFHVRDRRDLPDEDGADLTDMQAVRGEAIRAAGEMVRELDGAFTGEEWRMDVTDEEGRQVLTLRFSVTEHAR